MRSRTWRHAHHLDPPVLCLSPWASPVRMDWSTRSVVDLISMRRRSAGTLSPTTQGDWPG